MGGAARSGAGDGIRGVAIRAGVSVGTVSNVLNRPELVAPATRQRVQQAMADLSFVRNSQASALRAGRSKALGVLVHDIGNPFFTEVVRGIEQLAAEHGFAILICSTDSSSSREQEVLRFLEEQRVDGVLLTPHGDGSADQLRDRGTPVVLVDTPSRSDQCSVAVDDVLGGRLAGEHLLGLARETVAFVTGPDTIRQCVDRDRGLAASGVTVHRVMVPALTGAAGYEASGRLPDVDAVFCANDVVALGVLRGLLERGVRVPADLALVGYDDIEFAATAAVPLTSIRQPARELGRTAAALLLAEIAGPRPHRHEQVRFEPELVIRQSTVAVTG